MKPILEIKGISKKFRIRHETQPYLSLRDSISSMFTKNGKTTSEEFWAVKNVSFDIQVGESVGIIGKNGAGKSTLLKILSKITPPTEGKIIARGRIASLLEVGTGFHPELTGRENIFLNGSILGMKRKEIFAKYDEIVDFSGVEKFLDTPLKHYSSGMQLRLAFAVAAFLEPEILLIDEVLSVGDAEFQKKCMGKMEGISKSGRTIIFVSHNMTAIQNLCSKTIYLESGKTTGKLTTHEAVQKYLYGNEINRPTYEKFSQPSAHVEAYFTEAKIFDKSGALSNRLETCEPFFIETTVANLSGKPINACVEIARHDGIQVMRALDTPTDWFGEKKKEKGTYTCRVKIPGNLLNAGDYYVRLVLYNPKVSTDSCIDLRTHLLHFSLTDPMDERSIARGPYTMQHDSYVLFPALDWTIERKT